MTVLRIIDILFPAGRDSAVALVSIVQGDPKVGMLFRRSDNGGQWKVIGFGFSPAKFNIEGERTIVLSFTKYQEREN
jgi:hypothetical protein